MNKSGSQRRQDQAKTARKWDTLDKHIENHDDGRLRSDCMDCKTGLKGSAISTCVLLLSSWQGPTDQQESCLTEAFVHRLFRGGPTAQPPNFDNYFCNLRGHLQRCQMPDIENSRKTAEKGAEWATAKQPKNSQKNSRNTRKAVFRVFRLFFPAVFRLFCRGPLGTLFGCFSAVFNVGHLAPL